MTCINPEGHALGSNKFLHPYEGGKVSSEQAESDKIAKELLVLFIH